MNKSEEISAHKNTKKNSIYDTQAASYGQQEKTGMPAPELKTVGTHPATPHRQTSPTPQTIAGLPKQRNGKVCKISISTLQS